MLIVFNVQLNVTLVIMMMFVPYVQESELIYQIVIAQTYIILMTMVIVNLVIINVRHVQTTILVTPV